MDTKQEEWSKATIKIDERGWAPSAVRTISGNVVYNYGYCYETFNTLDEALNHRNKIKDDYEHRREKLPYELTHIRCIVCGRADISSIQEFNRHCIEHMKSAKPLYEQK